MTPEQIRRLETLNSGKCVPFTYAQDYYGVKWPLSLPAENLLQNYTKTLTQRDPCLPGFLSRYDLEGFMSRNKLKTRKWTGASLGMSVKSLDSLLEKLDIWGMQVSRYAVGTEFLADSFSEDLIRQIPTLRFRSFGNHSAFCDRLHAELKNSIGLDVERLYCATSLTMKDETPLFSDYYDCLTLEPLSAKHSVWLDFRKPLNLPPDRCSKLLYVQNRDLLKPFTAGKEEPSLLDEYEHFLEYPTHA